MPISFLSSSCTCVSDINECARREDTCSDFAQCSNTLGSFECTCLPGYQGDGRVCRGQLVCFHFVREESIQYINSTEIDECASDTDNCDINADCINTGGSFECVCRTGYEGNGQVCTGILS